MTIFKTPILIASLKVSVTFISDLHLHSGNCKDNSLSGCRAYGQPVQCDSIKHLPGEAQDICQMPVARFDCNGVGIIKEYCRMTCSNCGKLYFLF